MNSIFFFLRNPKHFQWVLIVHGMRRGNNITLLAPELFFKF